MDHFTPFGKVTNVEMKENNSAEITFSNRGCAERVSLFVYSRIKLEISFESNSLLSHIVTSNYFIPKSIGKRKWIFV